MKSEKVNIKKSINAEGWELPPPHKDGCYNLVAKNGLVSLESSWVGLTGTHREVWSSLQMST